MHIDKIGVLLNNYRTYCMYIFKVFQITIMDINNTIEYLRFTEWFKYLVSIVTQSYHDI